MTEITYLPEEKGQLPFMVIWQSLDGRVEIEYLDSYEESKKLCQHLSTLGRNPKIWRAVQ